MVERRLGLNDPAAVLIDWVGDREAWRSDGVLRAGQDVAATGLPEVSTETPTVSGRARLKPHKEAVSRRKDGVGHWLSSTHTDKTGGHRTQTIIGHNTRVLRLKIEVGDIQDNTVFSFYSNDPGTISITPIWSRVIWRMNLSPGSLENPTTTSRDRSP